MTDDLDPEALDAARWMVCPVCHSCWSAHERSDHDEDCRGVPVEVARILDRGEMVERQLEGYGRLLASANDDAARFKAWGEGLREALENIANWKEFLDRQPPERATMRIGQYAHSVLDAAPPATDQEREER